MGEAGLYDGQNQPTMDDSNEWDDLPLTGEDLEMQKRDQQLSRILSDGQIEDAITLASGFRKERGEQSMAFKNIVEATLATSDFEKAKEAALACLRVDDAETYAECFRNIAVAQARQGLLSEALHTVDEIQDDIYWQDDARVGIIGALAQSGRIAEAEDLMNSIQPDAWVRPYGYLGIVKGMVKQNAGADSIASYIQRVTGKVSRDHLYMGGAQELRKIDKPNEALKLAEHIQDPGIKRQALEM